MQEREPLGVRFFGKSIRIHLDELFKPFPRKKLICSWLFYLALNRREILEARETDLT